MTKKILITGGTSGIGLNAAKNLAFDHNNHLILIGNNIIKGKLATRTLFNQTNNKNIFYHKCDLSSFVEIKNFFDKTKIPMLDVLVNNAGAVFFSKEYTEDNIEKTFALNHLGYFLFTNLILKKKLIKPNSKIINVSSGAHWGVDLDFNDLQMDKNYNGWIAYKKSKLCNILFTKKLGLLLQKKNVKVNCLHPGFVQTGFASNNNFIISLGIKAAMKLIGINVDKGTETLLYLINTDMNISGKYFYKKKITQSSAFSNDIGNANKLWDKSLEIVSKFII